MRCADGAVRVDLHRTPHEVPADAVCLFGGPDDLFTSRWWWQTVVDHAVPQGGTPLFPVVRINGQAAGLLPLLASPTGSVLGSLTTPYTCRYTPMLSGSLNGAAVEAVARQFGRFCRTWPVTRLDAIPADWRHLASFEAGLRAAGLKVLAFDHFTNWYLPDVVGGWAAFLKGRPGALRETIRRRLRDAERTPEARFVLVADPHEASAGVAAFEEIYARSWKTPEPFPTFNGALIRACAESGSLRLGLWLLGERPVATQFWVVERSRATVLKLAHDEAYKAHSPGTVLSALMLRYLLDNEGITAVDFGRGDDTYKQAWTGSRRQRIGLLLINRWHPRGAATLLRHTLGRVRAGFPTYTGQPRIDRDARGAAE